MKKSIKLSALFLLLSASVFAGTTKKETNTAKAATAQQVSFAGSKGVSLNISTTTGSAVSFYDADKNMIFADRMGENKTYNLGSLDNGTYLVKIAANHQEVTKKVVVYEDNDQKSFFIVQ